MVKIAKYDFDWKTIHKSYLAGKSLKELASELNCSYQCVSQNFKKRNLKIMTLSEAGLRSKNLKRGASGKTRQIFRFKGKRIQVAHYNWCVANNFPYIPKGFVVHHVDNNRQNNDPTNLVLLPNEIHKSLHYALELVKNPDRIFWGINKLKQGDLNS